MTNTENEALSALRAIHTAFVRRSVDDHFLERTNAITVDVIRTAFVLERNTGGMVVAHRLVLQLLTCASITVLADLDRSDRVDAFAILRARAWTSDHNDFSTGAVSA